MNPPEPLPGTHLAEVDCIDCGAATLAAPQYCDDARCTACWEVEAIRRAALHRPGQPGE